MTSYPWGGKPAYPVTPQFVGGSPTVRAGYDHFNNIAPERPVRAIGVTNTKEIALYNRLDQILLIEKALAIHRVENQIAATLSQLALGIRNADNFLERHILAKASRPSIHTLWFHQDGLRDHQHILSSLAAHHIVPLFSVISYDVEKEKMTVIQAEELYEELMDCSVAQPKIVQRELSNQMVRSYCLHDDFNKALEVIDEMKTRDIRRTFVTYAPLFRMVRAAEDAEKHLRLLQYMYRVEGGRWQKFLLIDVPRSLYMGGVFLRYNWIAINVTFTAIGTAIVMCYCNFGVPIL